jgi:hypothetical protein
VRTNLQEFAKLQGKFSHKRDEVSTECAVLHNEELRTEIRCNL